MVSVAKDGKSKGVSEKDIAKVHYYCYIHVI